MSRRHPWELFFLTLSFIVLFGINVAADMIKCPVCGEIFKQDVEICPNDGTDLKILGKPVSKKDETKKVETEQPDDSASVNDKGTNESKNGEGAEDKKYRRQDKGGSRKRVDDIDNDDAQNSRRTDRMKRIGDTRSGGNNVQRDRKREAEEWARMDAEIREQHIKKVEEYRAQEARRQMKQRITGISHEQKNSSLIKGAPLVALGARLAFMPEGKSPGRVSGAEIDVNFLRGTVRLGVSSFAGSRLIESRRDFIFNGSLTIGFQHPGRFSPFVLGRFGIGVLAQSRFGENIIDLLRNMGVEAGVDCRLNSGFAITPSVGFSQYAVHDVSWNSVALKLSVGF